jgi:eukaryotic-like serine/threonine-protein kinase
MALAPGSRLGPYEILAPLGAGGMGEVYRARDTRLGREVAVKVLPADRLKDEARRRRFVQEARAASSLNHPNIVTIHEIERDGDADFIVMELVSGKSLDRLIPRNGMPLPETLRLAIPMADALSRAHAVGIVHRDLKPANVVVSDEGVPKILDFGLAKLLGREDVTDEDTLTEETAASPVSQPGAISGTPAYMSPEQATARKVDARSDVFGFGSVLYEMVTGRRAFAGATRQETLSAVVSADPRPPHELAPGVPAELEKLILRCLRKDPDRRPQHMADVRVALREASEELEAGGARARGPVPSRASAWRRPLVVMGILSLAAGGALVVSRLRSTAPDRSRPISRVTWDSGLATDPAPSPAGDLLAYASDRGSEGNLDIWLQPLPRGEPIRLTDDPSDDHEPSFSPDGSRIAFRSERDGGGVYVASALGGPATRIAEKGRRPRFSPDGQWIAYYVGDTVLSGGAVFVVASGGGSTRQIGPSRLNARRPIWSPDGSHLLCVAYPDGGDGTTAGTWEWVALPLEGGAPRETGFSEAMRRTSLAFAGGEDWSPAAMPDAEHVLFSARSGDSTNVWRFRLSPTTWRIAGPPEQVTFGTGTEEDPAVGGSRLFFVSAVGNVDIWSLPLDPRSGRVTGEPQRLTRDPGRDDWPSISADGRRLAFLSERAGIPQVRLRDLEARRERSVTVAPTRVGYPRISSDGSKVVYLALAPEQPGGAGPRPRGSSDLHLPVPVFQRGTLFVAAVSPSGDVGVSRPLCEGCTRAWDWSRDGRYIAFRGDDAILLLDTETGSRTRLASHEIANGFDVRFSPDDAWITFTLNLGFQRRRTVIAPFRGPVPISEAEWVTVIDSDTLDRQAAWSPDGSALYLQSQRDGFRCLWAQRLDPVTKHPVGAPFAVHHFHGVQRSMTASLPDPGAISIAVARDRIVFALGETTGNIWMTTY